MSEEIDAEPVAAEELPEDTSEPCAYLDCNELADYRVEWKHTDSDARETSTVCDDCSTEKRVYAMENDLLDNKVTA